LAHGQITHIELPADDTARARRFYSELFGWQFTEMEGYAGYFLFNAGSAEIGGAVGERGRSAPERLRVVCEVDSIDKVLERAPELGGAVVEGRSEITGVGYYAVIRDPEGNEIGLYEGQA
jgi:uncharacterized protein